MFLAESWRSSAVLFVASLESLFGESQIFFNK